MTGTDDSNGYSLFYDVEDAALRERNRAACLINILSKHTQDNGKVGMQGFKEFMEYVNCLPLEERQGTVDTVREELGLDG